MPEIIVASCAAYRDTWDPFHALLGRFWPDRPWRMTLVTDVVPGDGGTDFGPFEDAVGVGGKDWCGRLTIAMRERDSRAVVLLLQDDFFLSGPVDTHALREAAALMASDPDIGCLRLNPCPGPLDGIQRGTVSAWPWGEIRPGERYRISCQASLWRVGYLKRALSVGGTPSDFENIAGPLCSEWPERVLSVLRSHVPGPIPYYCTAIVSGCWQEDALELCRQHGVQVQSTRPVAKARR